MTHPQSFVTKVALHSLRRAAEKAVAASGRRDDAIRKAHADGVTIRVIAEAVSLSPARVHQIIHRR